MKKNFFILIAIIFAIVPLQSCGSSKKVAKKKTTQVLQPQKYTMNLSLMGQSVSNKYANLDYGISLNVQDDRNQKELIQRYDVASISKPITSANPGIGSFVSESVRRYMRNMGFNMNTDISSDYLLQMKVKEFHTDFISGMGWQGNVIMDICVYDHNRTLVYSNAEVAGRASVNAPATSFVSANQALNIAYLNALKDIDWDRLAFFLHRSDSPKQEANKKVTGDGSTALEHLVVHWNVNSRPQGADVYWRVISKTPEVKSQNYKYLETTPFEGNETLNIKGLTYNTAGLVQIEIKVEKEGYYSQTKKYDVLSLIDDNDVSYMFRLVKEE